MTAEEMIQFLGRLHDPGSQERQIYRKYKAAGTCRFCSAVLTEGIVYCLPCYTTLKAAQELAVQKGICRYCFCRPVSLPRGRKTVSKLFGGRPTRCQVCRDEAENRKLANDLERRTKINEEDV